MASEDYRNLLAEIDELCESDPKKVLEIADAALKRLPFDQAELRIDFRTVRGQSHNRLGQCRDVLDTSFEALSAALKIDYQDVLPHLYQNITQAW